MTKLTGICAWILSTSILTGTTAVQAAEVGKVDVKALQEQNQQLSDQLKKAQEEIAKLKAKPEAGAVASRDLREVNVPLPLTPAEQANAPANSAAATSTVPLSTGAKDFTLAIGSKFWVNEWNTWRSPNIGNGFTKGTNIQTLTSTSDGELSGIPNLTLRYKKFFLTGSYLAPTDYRFPLQRQVYAALPDGNGAGTLDYALKGTREEWDISMGYQFIPYMAFSAGYKEIKQEFSSSSCFAGTVGGTSVDCIGALGIDPLKGKFTYGGPTLGISGAAPIGHGFGLYSNFTYAWLGANYSDKPKINAVNDVDYYVGEFGFTYSHLLKELPVYMPLSSATLYAGYRYQSYKSHLRGASAQGSNNPKDVVQGFVSGVNLAF